jgi:hypothetical protein
MRLKPSGWWVGLIIFHVQGRKEKKEKESDAEWTNYIEKNDKLVGDFFYFFPLHF